MSDHICTPGCTHGITEENRKDVLDEFDTARRSFLRNTLVGGGAVGLGALGLGMTPMAHAASGLSLAREEAMRWGEAERRTLIVSPETFEKDVTTTTAVTAASVQGETIEGTVYITD